MSGTFIFKVPDTFTSLYSADTQRAPQVPSNSTAAVQHLHADPYGVPREDANTGELADVTTARYLGFEWDKVLGIYTVGHRLYDPVPGRLLNTDIAIEAAGQNPYVFARNSPQDRESMGRVGDFNAHATNSLWANFDYDATFEDWYGIDNGSTRAMGAVQAVFGVVEVVGAVKGGIATCAFTALAGCAAGLIVAAHGFDNIVAGAATAWTGKTWETGTKTVATYTASGVMSQQNAERFGTVFDMVVGMGASSTDDFIRAGLKYGLTNSADDAMRLAARHAAGHFAVQAGVAGTGALIGGAMTGTWDGALQGASYGSMVGGLAADFMVACFAAGTRLLTPDGDKAIEDIRVGDAVLSRDENDVNGPVVAKPVEGVFVRLAPIFHLHIGGQVLRTTAEHPFFVEGKGWTPGGELKIGDLLASHDGTWWPVEDLLHTGAVEVVYNLRVADLHTYFVGSEVLDFSVWAHNSYKGAAPNSAINPRLTQRLEAFRAYQARGGTMDLVRWVKATQGNPAYGTGFQSGFRQWSQRVSQVQNHHLVSNPVVRELDAIESRNKTGVILRQFWKNG